MGTILPFPNAKPSLLHTRKSPSQSTETNKEPFASFPGHEKIKKIYTRWIINNLQNVGDSLHNEGFDNLQESDVSLSPYIRILDSNKLGMVFLMSANIRKFLSITLSGRVSFLQNGEMYTDEHDPNVGIIEQ